MKAELAGGAQPRVTLTFQHDYPPSQYSPAPVAATRLGDLPQLAEVQPDQITPAAGVDDDIAGDPTGHFVVISGYDHWGRRLTILDPSEHVPESHNGRVQVESTRLINAIMLGDATYDAVLLELWPPEEEPGQ